MLSKLKFKNLLIKYFLKIVIIIKIIININKYLIISLGIEDWAQSPIPRYNKIIIF